VWSGVKTKNDPLLEAVIQRMTLEEEESAIGYYFFLASKAAVERCQAIVMEQAPWCFSKASAQSLTHDLQELELKITAMREECWKRGYNVDDVDYILEKSLPHSSCILPKRERERGQDPRYTRQIQCSSRPWSSKQGRINLWLLQNITSSGTGVVDLHRQTLEKYTRKGKTETDEDWRRKVLKYWFIDEAATERRETASTNEAVDSEGFPHDFRVEL